MRIALVTIGVALVVFGTATFAVQHPYDPVIHRWEAALAVALAVLALAALAARGLGGSRAARFAALGGLGGIVIAVAFLAGELLVGPPQRISSAPGQTYRPAGSASLAVVFPAVTPDGLSTRQAPTSVTVRTGTSDEALAVGEQMRSHSYVLRADGWPAAYVRAWSAQHIAQTVTQPTGVAFVSPVLQFPIADRDGLLTDSFAVPALHREVRVKYYAGLPSRGITIPFLQLEIDEENGGSLFGGVAVSGRPVRQAGMELLFDLGTYPIVSMAGAPDAFVYEVGSLVLLAGIIGFAVCALWPGRPREAT